jgi:hypothetical protein
MEEHGQSALPFFWRSQWSGKLDAELLGGLRMAHDDTELTGYMVTKR